MPVAGHKLTRPGATPLARGANAHARTAELTCSLRLDEKADKVSPAALSCGPHGV